MFGVIYIMRAEGHSEMLARPREREEAQSDNTRRQIVKKHPSYEALKERGHCCGHQGSAEGQCPVSPAHCAW